MLHGIPLKWHPRDEQPRPTDVFLSRSLIGFTSQPGRGEVHLFDSYTFFNTGRVYHAAGTHGEIEFDYREPTETEASSIGKDTTVVEMTDNDHQLLEEKLVEDPNELDPLQFRLAQIADHIGN